MMQILLICFVFSLFTYVASFGGPIVGTGRWHVLNVEKCKNYDLMPMKFDLKRRKVNRTHDGFDAHIDLEEVIDGSYAVRLDVCKYVDGGCKPYQIITDESFENFVKKYAWENVQKMLTMLGVDPPEMPVPMGVYDLSGFIFDYTELPADGIIGKFGVEGFLVKDQREHGCIDMTMEFQPVDDD